MVLKTSKEKYGEGLGREKGRETRYNYNYNVRNKRENKQMFRVIPGSGNPVPKMMQHIHTKSLKALQSLFTTQQTARATHAMCGSRIH